MSEISPQNATRGRGRGKSRGGLGKYLRARGRGRSYGRPAEFRERLYLEGDKRPSSANDSDDEEDEEAKEERAAVRKKYSKRQIATNADRYVEQEPELGSDGEPIVEPEVDLSSFLAKQRLSDEPSQVVATNAQSEDEEVDETLAHITSRGINQKKKALIQNVDWDEELDEMSKNKAIAEANWDLKERFRANADRLRTKPVIAKEKKNYIEAPALPAKHGAKSPPPRSQKAEMEDFLDDLIS